MRAEGPKRPDRQAEGLIRVRFAPSPTGLLHLGNARTALFNWLFARQRGGAFVLRIEDTDPERSSSEFSQAIQDDLRWLGIEWDEGPYWQSTRSEPYRDAVDRLLASGRAYRCFCSIDALQEERRAQLAAGRPPRYSGRCRALPPEASRARGETGEAFTVRLKMPPDEIVVSDLVKGDVRFRGRDLDDFVLLRPDGTASYHLAVVVDDHAMGITHVIRGEDHLANTPRHMALAKALGYASPRFAHLPLILGSDGAPMSKRNSDFTVGALRTADVLPEAVVNYLGLLGWSPPAGVPEVMSLTDMARHFSFDRVSPAPARFDKARLAWFDQQHLRRGGPERLRTLLRLPGGDKMIRRAVEALGEEAHSLADLRRTVEGLAAEPDPETLHLSPLDRESIEDLARILARAPLGRLEEAKATLDVLLQRHAGRKKRDVMHAVRQALTGSPQGLPVATLLWILGSEAAQRRLTRALTAPVGP